MSFCNREVAKVWLIGAV